MGLIIDKSGDLYWERQPGHQFLNIHDEWEEIGEPATFMEAVKSGKKLKVKHNSIIKTDNLDNEYSQLKDIMKNLCKIFTNEGVKKILEDGTWYIED